MFTGKDSLYHATPRVHYSQAGFQLRQPFLYKYYINMPYLYIMISREIQKTLIEYAHSFRSVLIVGPRQSGKTTLAKHCFPKKPYVSLENIDEREMATEDPKAFLNRFPSGAILDEVQRAPVLLNYLQEVLDCTKEDGLFILIGSNNILLQESVSQTLAGRIGVLDIILISFQGSTRGEFYHYRVYKK